MSVHVMAWVQEHAPAELEVSEMFVVMALAWHADDSGRNAFPALSALQKFTHLSERSVRTALRRLEERGLVRVQEKATNRRPTIYRFPLYRGATIASQESLEGQPLPVGGAVVAPYPSENRQNVNVPYSIFAAACEGAGLDIRAFTQDDKSKYLGVAKRLATKGVTAGEAQACAAWLHGQEWRSLPVDLFDVEKNLGKWRAAGRPTREPARRPKTQADWNRGGTGKVVT